MTMDSAGGDRGRLSPMTLPACRFCGTPLRHVFVDLGMSPLCETFLLPDGAQSDGAVLSAQGLGLRALLPRAAPGVRLARRDLHRVRLLLLLLDVVAPARKGLHRHGRAAIRPRRAPRASSRSPATTGTSSSTSSRRAFPSSASSRRPTSRRPRSRRASRRSSGSSAATTAADLAGSHGKADLIVGNNVLAHVPDINDFVGGLKILLEAGRRRDDGVSAPVAPDRGEPVRHDLPRALLVSLLLDGSARSSRPTASSSSTSTDSRPTAARCGSTPATPTTAASDRAAASTSCSRPKRPPASARSIGT